MRNPDSVAEARDNERNSAPKQVLRGPEEDRANASLDMVRAEWRRLYRSEPTRISRDLLLRGIAYRRQELTHGGFEYAGTSYASLTKIAKKITGAHRSGPRFFGLVRAGRSPERGSGNA